MIKKILDKLANREVKIIEKKDPKAQLREWPKHLSSTPYIMVDGKQIPVKN